MLKEELSDVVTDKIDAFFGPCRKKLTTARFGIGNGQILSVLEGNGKAILVHTKLWFKKGKLVGSEVIGFVPLVA